jgi:small conductance mechanosensitive channel
MHSSFRFLAPLLLVTLALAAGGRSLAQEAPAPQSSAPAADVGTLIRILEDDRARAALVERLRNAAPRDAQPSGAIDSQNRPAPTEAAAEQAAKSAEGAAEPTIARQIAEYTRAVAERIAGLAAASATLLGDLSSIFTSGFSGPAVNWGQLIAVLATIGVTFGGFFALRALGIPFYRWIGRRASGAGFASRSGLLVTSVLVDALMVVAAWAAGYAFALQFGVFGVMNIQQTLYLNAFLFIELAKVALRAATSPYHAPLRALPIEDEAAAYWYFWTSRLVSLLGYTFLFVAPIVVAAVSPAAAQAIRVVVAFTALMMAIVIVLQNRDRVRERLAGRTEASDNDLVSTFYAFVARFWHWAALAWLVALFVVWLANPNEALPFMAGATLQTVIAIAVGALLTALISRLISGGMRLPQDVKERLPLLEARLNAFVPAILKAVRIIVLLAVLLAIAQSWAVVDFLGWLSSEVGARFATSAISAGLIVLVGVALFIAMSSWVEYRLNPEFGHVPTAREKTLLTLFRNALTIVIIVLVAMLALSQVGVNIAPLLAGAGVLGLAIGFGAQTLVKDIITGAFIQFENAMNTGDNVKVAGVQGTVEHLTIRSVGIRTIDGTYHLIPFSSVESVANTTKLFSYHMAEIGVAYREAIPDVKQAMQDAFDRLKETTHGASIIAPFELHGLTKFGDSSITVRGRIKTEPGKQWATGRAYNEIVKEIFDERGIEMPFPHVTLYMGEDKAGRAPPLRVKAEVETPGTPRLAAARGPDAGSRPRDEGPGRPALDGPSGEEDGSVGV